jgi:hypothetical protein
MKSKFVAFILILILGAIGGLIGYSIITGKISTAEKELKDDVSSLFDGKEVVIDGEFDGVGTVNEDSIDMYFFLPWNKLGFTVYELKKETGGYELKKTLAGSLVIFEPKRKKGIWGWEKNWARKTVHEYYKGAFDFLTIGNKGDENYAYTQGKYHALEKFPSQFSNEYWRVDVKARSEGQSVTEWESNIQDVDGKSYILGVHGKTTFYGIIKNENICKKAILFYSLASGGIGLILSVLIIFIIKLFKPKVSTSSPLDNIQWRNVSDKSIFYIERKTFGASKATLIKDNISKKGIATFQNEKQFNLKFDQEEYIYRIIHVDSNSLILLDLAIDQELKFTKIE